MRWMMAAVLAAMLAGSPAGAKDCGGEATEAGMNKCAADQLKAADAALNKAYRQIIHRLADDADTVKLLRDAQRAWVDFRDKHCAFAASGVDGGSSYPFIHDGCVTELTDARTRQLDVFLRCQEGDLGCPVPGP